MNIFVYSDESGVFDKAHNEKFVFAGLIFLGKDDRDNECRKYINAEKSIYKRNKHLKGKELKACVLSNIDKGKLYRSLNKCYKFCVIVDQKAVLERIFKSKKDKQRYLDYVYKIAIKRAFKHLVSENIIRKDAVENIYFFVDEHKTATNGRYELKEGLEMELKNGTYNYEYNTFFEPIFPDAKAIELEFCNSAKCTLIRAADIIANRVYYITTHENDFSKEAADRNLFVFNQP